MHNINQCIGPTTISSSVLRVKMGRLFGCSREGNRRFNLAEGRTSICTVRHQIPIATAELFARRFATTVHGCWSSITEKPCSAAAMSCLPAANRAISPFSIAASKLLLSPSNPSEGSNPLTTTGIDEMGNFLRSPRTVLSGRWQHKTHASLILRYYWRRVKRAFTPARHRTRSRNTQS